METAETKQSAPPLSTGATGSSLQPASAPPAGGSVVAQPGGSTEEQRRKWREKRAHQKALKAQSPAPPGGKAPAPVNGAALPGAPVVAAPITAAVVASPALPWSQNDLRDCAADVTSVLDAALVSTLKSDAAKVSPEAVSLVAQRSPVNPTLKARVDTSLSACGAKWLNAAGVSAEYKDEVILAGALALWLKGFMSLRSELREMALEVKVRRDAQKKEKPDADQN